MRNCISEDEGSDFLRKMQAIGDDCLREIGSNPVLLNLSPRPKADFIHDYFRQSLERYYPGKVVVGNNSFYLIMVGMAVFFKKGEKKDKYLPKLNETKRTERILEQDSGLFNGGRLEPLFCVWDADTTWSRLNFFVGQLESRRNWEWIQSIDQYAAMTRFNEISSTQDVGAFDYSTPAEVEFKDEMMSNDSEEVAV